MPSSFVIKQGDTLSKIAQANGTTVDAILAANKGNAAVKSANLIIAGGNLNLPDKVAAPAGGVAPGTGVPAGGLDPASQAQDAASSAVGEMGNLRMALKAALNEAGKNRVANNYSQMAGAGLTGIPGTVGSVVDMIRGSAKTGVESTFSDIMTSYKDATEAKQKELDRINQLRLEYGSAIPAGVTSLQEAIALVQPLVDQERDDSRRKGLGKLSSDQAEDDDIQAWAEMVASGERTISQVPSKIRTAVNTLSQTISTKNKEGAMNTLRENILFDIEQKVNTYEGLRSETRNSGDLEPNEKRELLSYIDGLENEQKASKNKKPSYLAPAPFVPGGTAQTPTITSAPGAPASPVSSLFPRR